MPFEIVRNDISLMQADAIVNPANPLDVVGYGADAAIHRRAGPKLLEARRRIGKIGMGQSAITPGFGLDARYVIHTVGPVWHGGTQGEEQLLRRCYDGALALAWANGCRSIAFPLLSADNHGVPKALALQVAVESFSRFLMEHDIQIWLVVFSGEALAVSEKLVQSVKSYIDENYIRDQILREYGVSDKCMVRGAQVEQIEEAMRRRSREACMDESVCTPCCLPLAGEDDVPQGLMTMLRRIDAGFSETLLELIDRTGKTDAEIYKKANVDRKLFSKIRSNPAYRPSKSTALAFAIALELDLEETKDFIGRAGHALSHASRFDIAVEYFILRRKYDLFEINQVLFALDEPLIGG